MNPTKGDPIADKVKLFKALSSRPRLEIVRLLKEHPQCVNALAKRLGLTQSAASQHLRVLREAGLVRSRKRGYWMHYEMPVENLERCGRVLAETFGFGIKPASPARGHRNCPPVLLKKCGAGGTSKQKKIGGKL